MLEAWGEGRGSQPAGVWAAWQGTGGSRLFLPESLRATRGPPYRVAVCACPRCALGRFFPGSFRSFLVPGSPCPPAWLRCFVSGPPLPPPSPAPFLHTGSALPVTAYDKNGFRILFHFAKECPPGRPDVLVVVVSMLNTAPLPIKSIVLQAAVPKVSSLPGASSCTRMSTPRSTSRAPAISSKEPLSLSSR